jgi:hypothetical protein
MLCAATWIPFLSIPLLSSCQSESTEDILFDFIPSLIRLVLIYIFAHRRRKVTGQKPPRTKPSPAIVPPTPDAPVRPAGPSASTQRASKMAGASATDARPATRPAKGSKKVSFRRKAVEMGAGFGEASKWKKKANALFRLDHLQEEASNHVSTAMLSFVQRTSIVKEVCTPNSPRAPWRISVDDPLWCSRRKLL